MRSLVGGRMPFPPSPPPEPAWHTGTACASAGCVPVFLGPPYNSMPLAYDVDYASIGVHFNITDTSGWLPEPGMHWEPISAEHHPTFPQEATWWVPDMDTSRIMIQVGARACCRRRSSRQRAQPSVLGHRRCRTSRPCWRTCGSCPTARWTAS